MIGNTPGDSFGTLVLAQLALLPVLTMATALLLRRNPARAHVAMVGGLLATLLAPPLAAIAAGAGLGILPGLTIDLSTATAAVETMLDDTAARRSLTPATVAIGLWTFASLVLLVRLALGFRRGWLIARSATTCRDDRIATALRRAAVGEERPVHPCRTKHLQSPAIFCWCREPRILLPLHLPGDVDPAMLERWPFAP